MKWLLDEQISYKVAEGLRARGVDAISSTDDLGLWAATDREVFETAQAEGRTIATFDVGDFIEIAQNVAQVGRQHHGIVCLSSSKFINFEFGRLVRALEAFEPPPGPSFVAWLADPPP